MVRKYFLLVASVICVLLFVLSFAGNIQAQPQQCTTDANCNDGLFCNGTETCLSGSCVAVSACPPYVDGCVIRGSICDEINDQCLDFADDSRCSAGQICDVITGQCLEGTSCSLAQQAAQDAVASGGTYKNHGQMVKTAAHAANPYLEEGVISEECHSCIVSQFAKGIPIGEQEPCGPVVEYCSFNTDCASGDYCKKAIADCIGEGTCVAKPLPLDCSSLYDPVCGCDLVTYFNDCEAASLGKSIAYLGYCK